MGQINNFLKKIDNIAPDPWYVDGIKQSRPLTQLGFFIGIIFTLIIVCLLGCREENPKVVKVEDDFLKKEVVEERVFEYPVSEYDSERVIDSTNLESYWYIHFHVSTKASQYDGYDVIKLNTSYFDIMQAIKIVLPNYIESDYVGIDFFKRVPYETYLSKEMKL